MNNQLNNSQHRSHDGACAICRKKFSVSQKLQLKAYTHLLADGAPCEECNTALQYLLWNRKLWIDDQTLKQVMGKIYNGEREYSIPVDKAKSLLALRNQRCAEILKEHNVEKGNVFVAERCFQIAPKPPIFFLRARKVRNKAVVQGMCLKGEFKKDSRAVVMYNGVLTEAVVLDAISYATARKSEGFSSSTFYDELSTNVHKHTVTECSEGWLILDIEADHLLPRGAFVAGK